MTENTTPQNPNFLKANYFIILFTLLTLLLSCNIIAPIEDVIVTFDSKGGSTVEPQTIVNGSTAKEPAIPVAPTPLHPNVPYIFRGWYTDANTTARFYFTNIITNNTTLYVKWNTQPTTKQALTNLITIAIGVDPMVNLNHIDTSLITDMSKLFQNKTNFNGDISRWNTSNVTNMSAMFYNAQAFNQDISSWNVSSVTIMSGMFSYAIKFNKPIDNWNVSKVTDMDRMFKNATAFNQNINSWVTSQVTHMSQIFVGSTLANNKPSWCTGVRCE